MVELMTQESHDPAGPAWLDIGPLRAGRASCAARARTASSASTTSRCASCRCTSTTRRARCCSRDVGLRRRGYPWPEVAELPLRRSPRCSALFEASFNTLTNAAQETIVDGMGRERQQYSGDGAHQLHATRLVCGDRQLARRFLRTFAMGQTLEGYFLDCWPAFDRLNRLAQRQVGATPWGPLLDHGVSFVLDAWRHYQETGESDLPLAALPALRALRRRTCSSGAARTACCRSRAGACPRVWIDDGFPRPRHKQCAFNLFTAAVLKAALAPLAGARGRRGGGEALRGRGATRSSRPTVARFWSARALALREQPAVGGRGGRRRGSTTARSRRRSSSTSVPGGRVAESVAALARAARVAGASRYPANSHWRMQALARHGRIDAVLRRAARALGRAALGAAQQHDLRALGRAPRLDRPVEPLRGRLRSSCSTWTSRASGPARPASRRRRSAPSSATSRSSSSSATRRAGRSPSAPRRRKRATARGSRCPPDCPGELVLPVTEGRGVALTAADRALGPRALRAAGRRDDGVRRAGRALYLKRPSFFSRKISTAAPATATAHCAMTP